MASPQLTEDTIEAVLDELGHDGASLLACLRVAKTWVVPAQKRLAASITIHDLRKAARVGSALRRAPWLATHIFELRVSYEHLSDVTAVHGWIGVPLRRLRVLQLRRETSRPARPAADDVKGFLLVLPHFWSTRRVELQHAHFAHFAQFRCFLVQFRELVALAFRSSVACCSDITMPVTGPLCALQLQELDLTGLWDELDTRRVCTWLASSPTARLGVHPPLLEYRHMHRFESAMRALHTTLIERNNNWLTKCRPLFHLTTLCLPAFSTNLPDMSRQMSGFITTVRRTAPMLSRVRLAHLVDMSRAGFLHSELDWKMILALLADLGPAKISAALMLAVSAPGVAAEQALSVVTREVRSHPQNGRVSSNSATLAIHVRDEEGREVDHQVSVLDLSF